jgi:glutathione synthase/RimK-type ligase-like ATP-grasp enzyme
LVWLVTSCAWAEGEPGARVLDEALSARGIDGRWVCWDDPVVDWGAADLVAVRSTWDYVPRHREFLAWAARLDQGRLLNSAVVFDWNHHKAYLAELGAGGVPTVPTTVAPTAAEVLAALAAYGTGVVKPAVGVGGVGLQALAAGSRAEALGEPPEAGWVVQPLVESVRTVGETSVFVIDGRPVSQVDKLPAGGEVRVHEHFGGVSRAVALAEGPAAVAREAYAWLTRRFDGDIDYLRVDLLHWQDAWRVSELELIEPGLYLDIVPANAEPFADLVASRLARPER